jgi:hypothetical protein
MTRHLAPPPICDDPLACGSIPLERNRYFTGKYMTARDFAAEQQYLIGRSRLHNRLFHGWGVVCGLEVEHRQGYGCEDWVVVKAGVAIDCCGRELVVPEDTPLKLPLPWSEPTDGESVLDPCTGPFLICLRYIEEAIESVPVLYGDRCPRDQQEANRVRECAKIDFCDVTAGCWPSRGDAYGDSEMRECPDCDDEAPSDRSCLKVSCQCGEAVPIALIDFVPGGEQTFEIDTSGRPIAGAQSAKRLTRIVGTNWRHGDVVPLSTVLGDWKAQLRVTFDRPLLPVDRCAPGTGIGQYTFVVQYAGLPRALEFVPACENTPALDPDDPCTAIFWIEPRSCWGLAGNVVHVTLRCDFILDCHGVPVDGNHLRGSLPTGDGIPGGVFESWFEVTFNGDDGRPEPGLMPPSGE